ncbi:hypothetical protein [Ruegeria atlantica]|uniref:hypothetical protein n=1 Tax=Ruegeria atlantica TaxID=81569 RepID=UPI002494B615|nr:hypothetical protein [Ruegeria atlantica]
MYRILILLVGTTRVHATGTTASGILAMVLAKTQSNPTIAYRQVEMPPLSLRSEQ